MAVKLLYLCHQRRFKVFARAMPFAREMVRRGHDVTLLCIADQRRVGWHEDEEDGVRIVEAPDFLPGKLRSGWDFFSIPRRIRHLRGLSCDVVHAFETRPTTIHPLHAYRRNHPEIPVVMDWIDWWGRGGLITELRPKWYQHLFGGMETWYEEHFRTEGTVHTVISHALKQRAIDLGVPEDHIHWIHGGVDSTHFRPLNIIETRREYNLDPNGIYLAFSALDVTNDLVYVLDAFRNVLRTHPHIRLLMAGNKSPALDPLLKDMGLDSSVHHAGYIPVTQLPRYLNCADIFLLPFTHRTSNLGRWPHKIGDYLAMGRPVVTNPVGEMKALFENHDMGLLAEETPEAFAQAIRDLADQPDLRRHKGKIARHVAEKELTWHEIGHKLLRVYEHALNRPL